ncbi:MAG: hypothetical protein F6K19_29430 [Cyanothece sp. SIO1E1]|nr:hypothetical protein [Cyanothece sp. SIO1E1]
MKRLILSGLSVLLLSSVATSAAAIEEPVLQAQNSIAARNVGPSRDYFLNPFDLVSLGRQGRFERQGIQSHGRFVPGYRSGKITGQRLVEAAVAENLISADAAQDQKFIDSVDAELRIVRPRS